MVTTNDHQLWDKMWSYKDHGKTWQAVYEHQHPPGFRWVHDRFGSNYRMTEMQAAIGLIQLKRMKDWTSIRQKHAQAIWQAAAQLPAVQLPESNEQVENACYKCYLFIRPEKLKPDWNRNRIIEAINTAGVPCYSGSCGEVYLEKAFDNTPWRPKTRLTQAQLLAETSLMFLVHPTLTQDEIEKTISVMTTIIKEASQ
jgi:dTDP-4-amino-4,6-dideoxygalactose transaminase